MVLQSTINAPTVPPATVTLTSLGITPPLTNITENMHVPCDNTAVGTYSLSINGKVWPVVQNDSGRGWYPQGGGDGKAPSQDRGQWSGPVHIGDCTNPSSNSGHTFLLKLGVANAQANQAFEKYLAHPAQNNYQGVDLPPGFQVYYTLSVIGE